MGACLWMATVANGCVKDKDNGTKVVDYCPDNPNKTHPGVCGCDTDDIIDAYTGLYTCNQIDLCPNDPQKTDPGICGCGVADTMGNNGLALCLMQNIDLCPNDPNKTLPGICGCGVPDTLDPTTGVPNCLSEQIDLCPDDETKTLPGVCGCGTPDSIDPETGIPTCTLENLDFCPDDPKKTRPGICGCGNSDVDSDGDGFYDCQDDCPMDDAKVTPGTCGCDVPDSNENLADDDSDHVPNCLDYCSQNPWKSTNDGCGCQQLKYELYGVSGCAQIIETASDFITFRDNWNEGIAEPNKSGDAYILVQDINLGDVLTPGDAAQWIPVGTEQNPFNGLFIGNNHKIHAVRIAGMQQETLTLGQISSANMALFGYTSNASFYDLRLELVVKGSETVASLVAIANATTINNVSARGEVYGDNIVGGIVANAYGATIEYVNSAVHITASGDIAGGVVGQSTKSVIKSAGASGKITAMQNAGGLIGTALQTTIINAQASGTVTGASFTGGLIGSMVTSKLYNAFTTTKLTCYEAPCALLVANVSDSSTIKNVYTTGLLENLIPPNTTDPPHHPSPEPSDDEDDPENPGEGGSNNDPGTPITGTEPADGEDCEDSEDENCRDQNEPDFPYAGNTGDYSADIDTAALIAAFSSNNNTVDMLYYWQLADLNAVPDACLDMPMVSAPQSFVYTNLRPYIDSNSTTLLLTKLNSNLSCTNGLCILDSEQCQQWITRYVTIEIPGTDHKTMSVNLPVLDLPSL